MPLLAELELVLFAEVVLDDRYGVKDFIFAVGLYLCDNTREVGVEHKSVLDDRGFGYGRVDLTAIELVAYFDLHCDVPESFGVERCN